METDVGGTVDAVGKVPGIIGFVFVFTKSEVSLPQTDEQPIFGPSGDVVSVKVWFPGIYLISAETGQAEHFIFKFKVVH